MARWLQAEREARTMASSAMSEALLRAMLAECLALWRRPPEDLVGRVRSYVQENMQGVIRLEDLSEALDISRYHLIRKYRGLTGHTPMADVTRLRVERARDLVLTTALPLKEIPPLVGLGDVYRLGKLFRRHLGITPGSLRRRRSR